MRDLERSADMYRRGLGLDRLDGFIDHEGFDGVMLGFEDASFHLELTSCRFHPILPSPTQEDLLVLYFPNEGEWTSRCASMTAAGFMETKPFNPFWGIAGKTFEDPDGYRVVLQRAAWENQSDKG